LSKLDSARIRTTEIAGDKIERVLTTAPGNDAPIGGVKVISKSGWFAARPSGTENIYKIYAESFRDEAHLQRLLADAQSVVDAALAES
jgi:phosphoglucomutase